jgi:hypothetical protein
MTADKKSQIGAEYRNNFNVSSGCEEFSIESTRSALRGATANWEM